ncbi:hypothetical protein BLD44_027285 [Mastigocladus laminosus UU774]|nr:hypothetical protein B4U84_27375 [Westiellopsis prolifica IICB1]TFI51229.1 hypothetical protein BLD44_027285 [Mastigocladus laminosus UU774]
MYQLTQVAETIDIAEIKKGFHRVGLTISESELDELRERKSISLESRGLSEMGLVFILLDALSKQKITFQNLPQQDLDSVNYSGIPIYSWDSQAPEKSCLYFNFVDGKPIVSISNQSIK